MIIFGSLPIQKKNEFIKVLLKMSKNFFMAKQKTQKDSFTHQHEGFKNENLNVVV